MLYVMWHGVEDQIQSISILMHVRMQLQVNYITE